MAKEIKLKLEFDDDFDFDLVAISCHNLDYQLVFEINKLLGFKFEKCQDPYLIKRKDWSFETPSFYEYIDEEQRIEMFLVKNKILNKLLMKELNHVDYFLIIKENLSQEMKHLIAELRKIEIVLHAQEIDPTNFDSAKNLEF